MKFGLVSKLIFAVVLISFATTIGHAYSLGEANAIKARKDWNGLLQYGQAWAQAEPNNSNAWGDHYSGVRFWIESARFGAGSH